MANHPIRITASDTTTGDLTMDDNGNTFVDPGDTVTWLIGRNSGVIAFTGFLVKTGSTNVFDACDPVSVGNSSNWQGTINPSIAKGTVEDYSILWTDTSGGNHTYDPKISVNT